MEGPIETVFIATGWVNNSVGTIGTGIEIDTGTTLTPGTLAGGFILALALLIIGSDG